MIGRVTRLRRGRGRSVQRGAAAGVRRGRMRLLASAAVLLLIPAATLSAAAADCGREAFSAVVSQASGELAAINNAQKAGLHEKLQLLKARQGWADGDFVSKATPFVQDAKIAEFDQGNKSLLARVPQLGAPPSLAGAVSTLPGTDDRNCAMLQELRGLMAQVVENTRAKWTYMLGKVDGALEDARQAKAGQ
jgi:hypothetical protein